MALAVQFADWLKDCRKIVILGMGNPLRRDDIVGIEIVRLLKGKVSRQAKILDCETVPENFINEIERFNPTHVLMIDAAHLNDEPGRAKLIPPEKISGLALSTHAMPLYILAELIKERVKAKVMILGVQPKNIEFGEEMTPELKSTSKTVASIIRKEVRKSLRKHIHIHREVKA